MEKLWVEHKMLFLLLLSSVTLTYFHSKSSIPKPEVNEWAKSYSTDIS